MFYYTNKESLKKSIAAQCIALPLYGSLNKCVTLQITI